MSLPKSYVSEFRKTHGRSISLAEGPINETVVSHLAGHKDARLEQLLDFLPVRDRVALSRVGPELRSKVIRHEEAFTSRPEKSRKFELVFGSPHKRFDVERVRKMTRNEKKLMISTMEYAPLDGKIFLSTIKTRKYPTLGSVVGLKNVLRYKNYKFNFMVAYAD